MTIDEAIEHAEERACGNDRCAKDRAQLADWLRVRELRRARMEIDLLKMSRDGFKSDAQKYKDENARLRSELESVGTAAYLYGRGDLKDENAKLRELVTDMYQYARTCGYEHPFLRELGIEVDE